MTEALNLLRPAATASPDDLDAAMPGSQWTVLQVLQHAAGDQLARAAVLGAGPGPEQNPFEPSGQLGGSIEDLFAAALGAAQTVRPRVAAEAGQVPTPLPQCALPPATAAAACALDAAVHAWDITIGPGPPVSAHG
jgi:hypothetical protein